MSDRSSTENFWKAWVDFQWPEPATVFYRCYYKEDGTPDFYTMEDLPGQWIEVSQEVYLRAPFFARVEDGELKIFEPKKHVSKLKPDQYQGTGCDPKDICVVLNSRDSIKWKLVENEID